MAIRRSPDPRNPADSAPASDAGASQRPPRARKPPLVSPPPVLRVTAEARRALIAESAYLRAERRGFAPGHESEDWLAAEAEVDALLKVAPGGSSQ